MTDRIECPDCGVETEFVQFATGDESTVETDPSKVGDGILELRYCGDCSIGVENILKLEDRTVIIPQ